MCDSHDAKRATYKDRFYKRFGHWQCQHQNCLEPATTKAGSYSSNNNNSNNIHNNSNDNGNNSHNSSNNNNTKPRTEDSDWIRVSAVLQITARSRKLPWPQ
ncbi:unnamed protein product [Polarella glacialis]|uniref:Uncharacterized protein n=1 Tax=Polarella glacialis TaxID=89957 RepID=A0A813I812_POLGL|nr:unnamed protein product [Polarella glacialis]